MLAGNTTREVESDTIAEQQLKTVKHDFGGLNEGIWPKSSLDEPAGTIRTSWSAKGMMNQLQALRYVEENESAVARKQISSTKRTTRSHETTTRYKNRSYATLCKTSSNDGVPSKTALTLNRTDLSSSNAYVSHTTTTHAADVMRSTNSFSPNRLKPAMLTSSKLLTDLTKIKQISRIATLASSPLHKYAMLTSSDLLLNFTKIRKSQTFKKCSTHDSQLESETQTFSMKSKPPEIAKTRLIQQLILNTNLGLTVVDQ
ncbi:hypothetical protein F511_38263 [Dorcoceras hygrometricum]|uniref:Uncharacterized protein n=1 Tax=Dorcoceras hygrometricum TaxID=472368 RepID=A0A2Z7DCR2_9LAMI|nr:hypothetical protein F511_38263 [Dorcoceras hygrometricum]